jgi:hypothetical protein
MAPTGVDEHQDLLAGIAAKHGSGDSPVQVLAAICAIVSQEAPAPRLALSFCTKTSRNVPLPPCAPALAVNRQTGSAASLAAGPL